MNGEREEKMDRAHRRHPFVSSLGALEQEEFHLQGLLRLEHCWAQEREQQWAQQKVKWCKMECALEAQGQKS